MNYKNTCLRGKVRSIRHIHFKIHDLYNFKKNSWALWNILVKIVYYGLAKQYCKIIKFHGHKISWFDNDVRENLN